MMFLRYGTKAQGTKEKINKALKFKTIVFQRALSKK
jgi:hypothetical protein